MNTPNQQIGDMPSLRKPVRWNIILPIAIGIFLIIFTCLSFAEDSNESAPAAIVLDTDSEKILADTLAEEPSAEDVTAPTPVSCLEVCSEKAKGVWDGIVDLKHKYFPEEESEVLDTSEDTEVANDLGNVPTAPAQTGG